MDDLKLVIEYHYTDGDVGAYPGGALEMSAWEGFCGKAGASEPDHIIIRRATKEGD